MTTDILRYRGFLSGLSHYFYNDFKLSIKKGTILDLQAVVNRFDVAVYYADTQIGWIPKGKNEEIIKLLKVGVKLKCYVIKHELGLNDLRERIAVEVVEPVGTVAPAPPWLNLNQEERLRQDQLKLENEKLLDQYYDKVSLNESYGATCDPPIVTAMQDGFFTKPDSVLKKLYNEQVAARKATKLDPKMSGSRADSVVIDDTTTEKENIMTNKITAIATGIAASNFSAAKTAAVMEAGRIANVEITKVLAKRLPMMVKGYADTPAGRLVVANLAGVALQQFRPNDARLKALVDAMQVQAYQELLQTIDIEGFIDGLLENPKIKNAVGRLTSDE